MTDKELKNLKRTELLELLLFVRKQVDELKIENQNLKDDLEQTKKNLFSQQDKDKIMTAVEKIVSND